MTSIIVPLLLSLVLFGDEVTGFVTNNHNNMVVQPALVQRQEVRMMAIITSQSVESLLDENRAKLEELAPIAPEMSTLERLRFAMAFRKNRTEARRKLREAMKYRKSTAGKPIIDAATQAYASATNAEGGWDNDVVRDAAPHAAIINKFITPKNILTLSTEEGDLLYVIRASLIDDKTLMSSVSVEQMTEFFLYVKEIHNLVANARSEKTGRLCEVIFANDISGISAIPDSRFFQALTESSQQYEELYPSLAGPTMILNLPFVLQAFIGLIKPLFPSTVQDRLAFESAPVLEGLDELTPLTTDADKRKSFLAEIKSLLS
uniref:CRAL-TRIO domain-containing protein n=1 Tax=Eucampia antarctica TaxID=49252 RepID=A0A7S2R046_9STRA|mmetsp:Transcript_1128/g.1041  ORF Transcript_1128/g.1041 Transcript_1128/m.1041 type:complete len:319 (+) Transcript_1128:88-1044(+)